MNFKIRLAYVNPHDVRDRIIFNPNYGGRPCTVPGTCIIPIRERKIKPKFFVALKESMELEGFRNPIVLYNTKEGLLLSFGGSRLRVAKELDMPAMAIVVDYNNQYNCLPLVTPDNYKKVFTDVPEFFEFTDVGIETHYSLERNRRNHYDPKGMEWTEELEDIDFLDEEFPWLSPEKR